MTHLELVSLGEERRFLWPRWRGPGFISRPTDVRLYHAEYRDLGVVSHNNHPPPHMWQQLNTADADTERCDVICDLFRVAKLINRKG